MVIIPSLGKPDKPKCALALSAVAVCSILSYTSCRRVQIPPQSECALKLWRDGQITIASQKASPSGSGIIKVVNKESGKVSTKSTDFTQANWAAATDEYVAALEKNFRDDAKFEKLIDAAKALMTSN